MYNQNGTPDHENNQAFILSTATSHPYPTLHTQVLNIFCQHSDIFIYSYINSYTPIHHHNPFRVQKGKQPISSRSETKTLWPRQHLLCERALCHNHNDRVRIRSMQVCFLNETVTWMMIDKEYHISW